MTETATQRQNGSAAGSSYRDSLKSMDTEEHIDLYFYRRIGYAWAVAARKLGVTPNAITIASIFLGLGAGVMFYFSNIWLNIVGMLLLIWANSFDSADGQLARMTHQYSRLGRILDGLSGDIWFAAIYVAICLRENVTSEFFMTHQWVIWAVAVVTGICHAKQAAMADYHQPGGLHPCHAGFAQRTARPFRRVDAPAGLPRRIPPPEPSADEIYEHPLVQLAHDSALHVALPRDAVALFRF